MKKLDVDKLKQEYIKRETERRIAKIEEEAEMYAADFRRGYEDREAHCYNKWYRYTRRDSGAAYDAGCVAHGKERHSAKWYREDEEMFCLIECAS